MNNLNDFDSKKMQKIVDEGILQRESESAEEISEMFIEYLKENVKVIYNNDNKMIKDIPLIFIPGKGIIEIEYIANAKLDIIGKIKDKYNDSKTSDKISIFYSESNQNKEDLKDLFVDEDDFKILEGIQPYLQDITFDKPIQDFVVVSLKRYLKDRIEKITKEDLKKLIIIRIKFPEV